MSRIKEAFKEKKSLAGFLTAGDPTLDKTEEFIEEMEKAGAALIEIGIPFSDPIAEGSAVQEANVRALAVPGGCTTDMVLDMVERVSRKVSVPLVLFTYLNPIFKYGYDAFFARCKKAGAEGVIIPDLPYEERGELLEYAKKHGVEIISMIAPASPERIRKIAKEAEGYLYMITGDKEPDAISDMIENIRSVTKLPIAVCGCADLPPLADGLIMGSEAVELIGRYGADAGAHIYEYVKNLVQRINETA